MSFFEGTLLAANTGLKSSWEYLPLFRYGSERSSGAGLPLGLIGGPLLIDSGEAENTFLFECQDRFLVYNSLVGIRSVLFVLDGDHRDCYLALIEDHNVRLKQWGKVAGFTVPLIPMPFFVPIDVVAMELVSDPLFSEQLKHPDLQASLRRGILLCNQVSPIVAEIISKVCSELALLGWPLDLNHSKIAAQGQLSLRFQDKAEYVKLLGNPTVAFPVHVPTILLLREDVLALSTWEEVANIIAAKTRGAPPSAVYLKSAGDSAGICSVRLTASNFDQAIKSLKAELIIRLSSDVLHLVRDASELRAMLKGIASLDGIDWHDDLLVDFKRMQRKRRRQSLMLLQPAVEFAGQSSDSFRAVGVGCVINEDGAARIHSVAGQIFADSDLKQYQGSFLSQSEENGLTPSENKKVRRVASLFAAEGYLGPLGLDACRNALGELEFVFDCNPRLTAIYTALVVKRFLIGIGFSISSVGSFGYRGATVIHDLEKVLAELDRRELLFTRTRPGGVMVLPNPGGRSGYDLLFINVDVGEMQRFLEEGRLEGIIEMPSEGNAFHV